LTLVSSDDIITIKIDKKILKCRLKNTRKKQTKRLFKNKNLGCQMDIRETNLDYEMEKR